MENLVIYCKSYSNDYDRVVNLVKSIESYNVDNIPVYISVPSNDITKFKSIKNVNLIEDESVYVGNTPGWIQQQIVKSSFWKLGVSENYVCIDSDSYFIRPFTVKDFMFDDETPYTICHEYKYFFEFLEKHPYYEKGQNLTFNPRESFVKERLHIMELFNRTGVIYDFGPGPTIWSTKIWKSLYDNYMIYNNIEFEELISINPSEFTWYGEWLLYSQEIRLMPKGPLFKNYHYPHQYDYDKQYNYGVDKITNLYLGIGIQSIYNFE
jgi:hypothetical protein